MITDTFDILDKRFAACVLGNVHQEVLFSGTRWGEGPVYFPAGKYLVWSDIPNDRLMRFDETDGSVSTFQQPCGNHNGHTIDREGRLVSCEHLARRVSRVEFDGSTTVLAADHDGRRFNSPNDVVVKSDGSIWFTDPSYGIDSDYEGIRSESEIGASHVYRIDPATGAVTAVATDFVQPNGLAFSIDESQLYISDTGSTHVEDGPAHIRVFDVGDNGRLSGGRVFATCDNGLFDGFRLDERGNVWTSAGDGVRCYAPDGDLIGRVVIDEVVANVEFGGPRRNRLYICATTTLRSVYLKVRGAARPFT